MNNITSDIAENLKGLRYTGLSIVYMQTFGMNDCNTDLFNKNYIREEINNIDKLIFIIGEDGSPVRRFKLPGFKFSVTLDEPYETIVKGEIFVEMSLFFKKTITLTFRMMIDGEECSCSQKLTTDHLIELISLNLGAEHWNSDKDKTASNINLEINTVEITELCLDERGEWLTKPVSIQIASEGNSFNEVCRRYRSAILKNQKSITYKYQNFAYIDIWEDVNNYNCSLQAMQKEEDIITYIHENCKKEMVGLMTLYPQEWPYRTLESFNDVCGSNIAIDTDDLILLNSSMCVVFGTYGRRGKNSPTDWTEHLKERKKYHVSWPEYMLILEMVLAKKYTIAVAKDFLLRSTKIGNTSYSARESIEVNASVELIITQLLLKLDAVNYSKFMSHKIMFERTIKRLEIERDENNLKEIMAKVENSLSNLSKMKSLKQAEFFNIILGGISIASLFQVIFSEIEVPFLVHLGYSWAGNAGLILVSVAIFLVFAGIISLSIVAAQNKGMGTKQILKKSYRKLINREKINPEF